MNMLGGGLLPQFSNARFPSSGLLLWLDFADVNTLWQDVGRTVPAANGDVIGTWDDKSGYGRNAVQSIAACKPQNSNGVLFDGSNDYLTVSDPGEGVDFTCFVACKLRTVFRAWRIMLGHEIYNANNGWFFWNNAAGNYAIGAIGHGDLYTGVTSGSKYAFAFGRESSSGYVRLYKNGISVGETLVSSFGPASISLSIGCRHSNDGSSFVDYSDHYVYEVLLWNRFLTSGERAIVDSYLNGKWSLY